MSDALERARSGAPARQDEAPSVSRREVLSATGQAALATAFAGSSSLALVACSVPSEEPWQDETFWDDGTGWVDA